MSDDPILKKVLQNLGQIATETGKEVLSETGKMTESIITGKELLGNLNNMSDEELAKRKAEDEQKKKAEMEQMQNGQPHNVEGEIKQIRDERKQMEEEQEKQFLENIKRQREEEETERQQMSAQMESSPAHQKKKAGSAGAHGSKKSQMPDPSQQTQTGEFKKGID